MADELLRRAELHERVLLLFLPDGRGCGIAVIMAGMDGDRPIQLRDPIETAIELFRVAAREITATAGLDEEGVPRQQAVVNQEADGAGGVPRRVQDLDTMAAEGDLTRGINPADAAGFEREVPPLRLVHVDRDVGCLDEGRHRVDVVEVGVGDKEAGELQVILGELRLDRLHVPPRVYDEGLAGVGIPEDVDEILQGP